MVCHSYSLFLVINFNLIIGGQLLWHFLLMIPMGSSIRARLWFTTSSPYCVIIYIKLIILISLQCVNGCLLII